MQGKTSTGFEYEFDERILTDWRLTTAIVETQDADDLKKLKAAQEISRLLLGKEGEKKLMDHVAKLNDGFVPSDKFLGELMDIVKSNKVKNSKSSQSA